MYGGYGVNWRFWLGILLVVIVFGPTLAHQLRYSLGEMVATLAPVIAVGVVVAVVVLLVRAYRQRY